jgi:hypothetical protein
MKRRELLKKTALATGFIVATPTLLELLVSCQEKITLNWKPLFLDEKQAFVVEHLVDLILPASNTVGALELQIPKFIDLVLNDVLPKNKQAIFIKGAEVFHKKFEAMFDKDILKGSKEEFLELLSKYFNLPVEDKKNVFELLEKEESSVENIELYAIYNYLTCIREYTLFGYYTSKEVGTEILNYNPVPGNYNGCVPVSEVGNSSSI